MVHGRLFQHRLGLYTNSRGFPVPGAARHPGGSPEAALTWEESSSIVSRRSGGRGSVRLCGAWPWRSSAGLVLQADSSTALQPVTQEMMILSRRVPRDTAGRMRAILRCMPSPPSIPLRVNTLITDVQISCCRDQLLHVGIRVGRTGVGYDRPGFPDPAMCADQ